MALRLAFMGTPDFSVPVLQVLHHAGHDIVAVYSQPPRPAGRRGLELTPSPVARLAETFSIPVFTPKSLKNAEEQAHFASLKLDAAVVVAYGLLLPKPILDAPRLGCFNGHASLLPRWRGAAPIQRAIMAGDKETGMMIMKMDEGLDTGPVMMSAKTAISPDMTAGQLHDILSKSGADLMVKAMAALEAGDFTLTKQPQKGVTYASKISKEETRIDWTYPAHEVQKKICGLAPFPGAWCEMAFSGKKERVKLLGASLADGTGPVGTLKSGTLTVFCGGGAVEITHLQRAGSKALDSESFLRGAPMITEVF